MIRVIRLQYTIIILVFLLCQLDVQRALMVFKANKVELLILHIKKI